MKRSWIVMMMVMLAAAGAQSEVPEGGVRVHYSRPDAAFGLWVLHVWEEATESVTWETGLEPTGADDFGVYWDVGLQTGLTCSASSSTMATKKTSGRTCSWSPPRRGRSGSSRAMRPSTPLPRIR